MRHSLMMLALGVLLAACSTARSATSSSRAARATSAAQTAAAAPAVSATAPAQSTPTAVTATAVDPTPAAERPTVTQTATADSAASTEALSVTDSQIYAVINGYFIIGEVQNNSATPMGSIQVTAIYEYKPNGKPIFTIGTEKTSTLLDVIPAHSKAPFKLGPYAFGLPVTLYELKVQGQAGTLPRQDLVLQSSNAYAGGSWLYVRGEIKNTGADDAHYVKAAVTLYDSKGRLVGVMAAYTSPETIPAGSYATFQVSSNYWPNYDHFAVEIQGQ